MRIYKAFGFGFSVSIFALGLLMLGALHYLVFVREFASFVRVYLWVSDGIVGLIFRGFVDRYGGGAQDALEIIRLAWIMVGAVFALLVGFAFVAQRRWADGVAWRRWVDGFARFAWQMSFCLWVVLMLGVAVFGSFVRADLYLICFDFFTLLWAVVVVRYGCVYPHHLRSITSGAGIMRLVGYAFIAIVWLVRLVLVVVFAWFGLMVLTFLGYVALGGNWMSSLSVVYAKLALFAVLLVVYVYSCGYDGAGFGRFWFRIVGVVYGALWAVLATTLLAVCYEWLIGYATRLVLAISGYIDALSAVAMAVMISSAMRAITHDARTRTRHTRRLAKLAIMVCAQMMIVGLWLYVLGSSGMGFEPPSDMDISAPTSAKVSIAPYIYSVRADDVIDALWRALALCGGVSVVAVASLRRRRVGALMVYMRVSMQYMCAAGALCAVGLLMHGMLCSVIASMLIAGAIGRGLGAVKPRKKRAGIVAGDAGVASNTKKPISWIKALWGALAIVVMICAGVLAYAISAHKQRVQDEIPIAYNTARQTLIDHGMCESRAHCNQTGMMSYAIVMGKILVFVGTDRQDIIDEIVRRAQSAKPRSFVAYEYYFGRGAATSGISVEQGMQASSQKRIIASYDGALAKILYWIFSLSGGM